MIVGFTGTQLGMSDGQQKFLLAELKRVGATELHHGCCIGADEDANDLAQSIGILTVGHPPINQKKISHCHCDTWCLAKNYIERNHDIVDTCELLFVAPRYNYEQQRSGTWATFRYAKKTGCKIVIIER